jgi:uncharacterized protein YifN (PemK superfamily)
MKKKLFMEKYPVYTLEIDKNETPYKSVPEIIEYFKQKIQEHKVAVFIATFDHYQHTKNLNGSINPEIKDAKNIVFCFGSSIPNTTIMATKPKTIGICELEDKFVIDFIEAPRCELNETMESWAKGIKG